MFVFFWEVGWFQDRFLFQCNFVFPPRTPSQIIVQINYLPANKVPCCLSISSCVLTSLALIDLLLLGVIIKVCLYKRFPFLFFPVCVHRRSYPSLANANSLWPLSGNLGCVVEPSLRSLGLALPAGRSAAQIGKRNQGNLQPYPPITSLVRALIAVAVDKWPHLPSSQPPHTVTGVCETFFRTPVCVIVSVSVRQNRISAHQLVFHFATRKEGYVNTFTCILLFSLCCDCFYVSAMWESLLRKLQGPPSHMCKGCFLGVFCHSQ